MARDYQTDLGHIDLDPCNLHSGEAQRVALQLAKCLQALSGEAPLPGSGECA